MQTRTEGDTYIIDRSDVKCVINISTGNITNMREILDFFSYNYSDIKFDVDKGVSFKIALSTLDGNHEVYDFILLCRDCYSKMKYDEHEKELKRHIAELEADLNTVVEEQAEETERNKEQERETKHLIEQIKMLERMQKELPEHITKEEFENFYNTFLKILELITPWHESITGMNKEMKDLFLSLFQKNNEGIQQHAAEFSHHYEKSMKNADELSKYLNKLKDRKDFSKLNEQLERITLNMYKVTLFYKVIIVLMESITEIHDTGDCKRRINELYELIDEIGKGSVTLDDAHKTIALKELITKLQNRQKLESGLNTGALQTFTFELFRMIEKMSNMFLYGDERLGLN